MSNAGDDDSGGAGWSGPILDRQQKILDWVAGGAAVPFNASFAWPAEGVREGSPNHECGAWTGEAVRAIKGGTRAEQDRAFGVLLGKYFPRELGPGKEAIGLRVSEQTCPDNHTHQHDQGVAMARVAAVLAHKAGHPSAGELMERSGQLLRATSSLFQALATPGPDFFVCGPGMRSPGRPVWWWGTAFLRQIMGQPGPMENFAVKAGRPDLLRDRAAVAVRAIRWLQGEGDDLGGAALVGPAGVALKYEMTVYRGTDQHLAVIVRPSSGNLPKLACDWVRVKWGLKDFEATSKQVEYGLNWSVAPPLPPKGAQVLRFPAMWGRS
jgi:hypothetical protein